MSIREIINDLIDHKLGEVVYYDHDESSYYSVQHKSQLGGHYNPDIHSTFEPCLEFAGSGDYVGSTIDMANRRYVEEEYKELFEDGHVIYHHQGYGYKSLLIFFLRLPVARSGLFEELETLTDYPLLNDELESDIQQELLEESWDNWVSYDFESEIEKLTGIEFNETNWQSNLFWEILSHGDGSEYYPETGENIYVDFRQVFRDSDQMINTIIEHSEQLESGEYEIRGNWKTVGHNLCLDWSYKGDKSHKDRTYIIELHKNQKPDSVPDEVLKEFGLMLVPENYLFWEVTPVNAPLKDALKSGITNIAPIWPTDCYCVNCHRNAVMRVYHGDNLYCNNCPDCYNKLMEYWPKCEHCQTKNVSTSLQYSLLPELDTGSLTHCQDCKNTILQV